MMRRRFIKIPGSPHSMRGLAASTNNCHAQIQDAAAYNSSTTQAGYGWSGAMYARPGQDVCVLVWLHGDNLYSAKGVRGRIHGAA